MGNPLDDVFCPILLLCHIVFFLSCTPHLLGLFLSKAYALGPLGCSQYRLRGAPMHLPGSVAIRSPSGRHGSGGFGFRKSSELLQHVTTVSRVISRSFKDRVPSCCVVPRLQASMVPGFDFVFPQTPPTNWWLCIFHFSGRVQAKHGKTTTAI